MNDKFNGKGTFTYSNGDVFVGNFNNTQLHGQGMVNTTENGEGT